MAEWISYMFGYKRILINSGVGVRDYYKKRGYVLNEDGYMEKRFRIDLNVILIIVLEIVLLMLYLIFKN